MASPKTSSLEKKKSKKNTTSKRNSSRNKIPKKEKQDLLEISVKGFKSIVEEQTIEVAPLTILAGANNSGKSSIMQPLLMMKQTLEAQYDPGALLLNGPNVSFTSAKQFLSRRGNAETFTINFGGGNSWKLCFEFKFSSGEKGITLAIRYSDLKDDKNSFFISEKTNNNIEKMLPIQMEKFLKRKEIKEMNPKWRAIRDKCFFYIALFKASKSSEDGTEKDMQLSPPMSSPQVNRVRRMLFKLIHLQGLRDRPARVHPITEIEDRFPGTFDHYVASIINYWHEHKSKEMDELREKLKQLGLANDISIKRVDDTQVEIRVCPSTPRSKKLHNVADVGWGVSQVLPVLVSLIVAEKGQIVYVEQPEVHLHPKAQIELAKIFCDAAKRGVKVVAETHSELFLLGVQTLVAKKKMSPDEISLYWFKKDNKDITKISRGSLSREGTYGDWPVDFSDVQMNAQSNFLDAIHGE